jgi:hypothetical protein
MGYFHSQYDPIWAVFAAPAEGAIWSEIVPVAFITPFPSMMSVKFLAAVPVVMAEVHPVVHVPLVTATMSFMFCVRAGAVPARPMYASAVSVVTLPEVVTP